MDYLSLRPYKIYMTNFSELGLSQELCTAVADMGFIEPSEIQLKTLPVLLNQQTDLIGLAQTGTGKTAAFGLPLLQQIDLEKRAPQGLILSPTRELCKQITNELQQYARNLPGINIVAIYGGASILEQKRQIDRGAHIVVATPGRVKDMLERKMINLSQVKVTILDEADEMLNMGFYEDLVAILKYTPKAKNTWLFSATMPKEVAQIAHDFMNDPVEITVGAKNESTKDVKHEYYLISARSRYTSLKRLLDINPKIFAVIFCRTRRTTQKVAEQLSEDGYNAAALHGDLSQNQRDIVMKSFRNGHLQLLVATDVAARGIDVDNITHVIHYQLPDETEIYTHRSGRTGRAGNKGISVVLATRSEKSKLKRIEKIINQSFEEKRLPEPKEIVETRLLYQIQNLEKTAIHKDMDKYYPLIERELGNLDKETLLKKIFSVEIDRLKEYYRNETNTVDAGNHSTGGSTNGTRVFIGIGRKDGFTNKSLADFLIQETQMSPENLLETDVKGNFSFFNIVSSEKDKVFSIFGNYIFHGRPLAIEVAQNKPHSKKSKNKKGKRDFGQARGSRKRSRTKGGRKSNIENSLKRRRRKK